MKKAKLNIQGLARRDKGLMGSLIADPGHTFVSVDLSAGEPTVTTHYSNDQNYYDACFGLVGKEPYYDETGTLKIDDIYLTAASFSPLGRDIIKKATELSYDGMEFNKAWLHNPDVIRRSLKDVRALHKLLVLACQYGMGAETMVKHCYNHGFKITLKEAKLFIAAYWRWCPKVKLLGQKLGEKFNSQGYLVNDFGYRLIPDSDYKALNYWIQSSVSGLVNILVYKFFSICPEAQFVTVIHDEKIFQVPDDKIEHARKCMQQAVDSLNDDLKWSVKIRTGFVTGKTLYDAK
jgi:hypothetical protein